MTAPVFAFEDATRESAKARIGLQGPAGSGKTKTALRMAEKLADGGLIGLVDTERNSALKYAPVPGKPQLGGHVFKHLPMSDCSPENLIAAVQAAEVAGIAVFIVDSWSHFWAGKGGLLERVDEEARKPGHYGGSYTAWGPVNKLEQAMLDALLNFPGHVIVTMRTKNDYEMEGKKVTKVGVKTVQREGAEYELDVVIDMVKGTGTVTKTRYEPLDDLSMHHPGPEMAEMVLEQLGQGVDPLAALIDRLSVPVEALTLDELTGVKSEAARRRLLEAGLMHPGSGEPTTLGTLVQQRLGDVVVRMLADEGLTYQGALDLHARGRAEQWLDIQRAVEETDEVKTLGALIAERGKAVKPVPQKSAQERPEKSAAAQQRGGDDSSAAGGATAPQMRKIFAVLKELSFTEDREKRLRAVGLILRRQVPTMNDLSFGEAGDVIEHLEGFTAHGESGPEEFRAWLNAEHEKSAEPASA
ncbi:MULTISPECIES: ATP-binding protein [Streptomyces]|uniref:ATP-binding protein n=2 Tax=Bacteria TaxID=2 RepID=UPI0021D14A86|nr:ATP-binding protein [Streptomyces sp. NEAU-383]